MQPKNNNSNLPRRKSRTAQSKSHRKPPISRATRKYRRNPDIAGTFGLFNTPSFFNVWQENDRKFDEFMRGKCFSIIEKRLELRKEFQFALMPGLPFGHDFDFGITIQDKIYEDGVYQKFRSHYLNNLRNTINLNVEAAFAEWLLITYLKAEEISDLKDTTLQLEKEFLIQNKVLNPRQASKETIEADKLQREGKTYRDIAKIFLSQKDPNFLEAKPKTGKERLKYNDAIAEERNRIANAVSKYRKRQRDNKVWEKLNSHMGILFGFFRINEKSFVITPFDK